MFYNILEQTNTIMMENYKKNYIEQLSFGFSKEKHFPRQTRRSSHVWLQTLVTLEPKNTVLFKREPSKLTNYLITVPIYHSRSEEVGEALIEHIISKYCAPDCIIMDQDSAFMSTLMNYLFRKLNIKIKTIAPYNHQSLQAEHGIKSLSRILTKHLTGQGQMWHRYLP